MHGGYSPVPREAEGCGSAAGTAARRCSVSGSACARSPSGCCGGILSQRGFTATPCLHPGTSLLTLGGLTAVAQKAPTASAVQCRCPRLLPGSFALPSQLFKGCILSSET